MTATTDRPVIRDVGDLTVLALGSGQVLVVACDSVGGIGPKVADTVPALARNVAHFAVRVPMLELLSVGASPVLVVNNLSVEREPIGEEMIREVRTVAASIGMDPLTQVTGSTEDNVATSTTAIGITVLGLADAYPRRDRSRAGDLVFVAGEPLSAPSDVLDAADCRLPSLQDTIAIRALPGIHDIVPVGSRGIDAEIRDLVRGAGLIYVEQPHPVDLARSGGPSSCLIVTSDPSATHPLRARRTRFPLVQIGTLTDGPRREGTVAQ